MANSPRQAKVSIPEQTIELEVYVRFNDAEHVVGTISMPIARILTKVDIEYTKTEDGE